MTWWDPQLYLAYADERTQPARDLVARIRFAAPERIIDVGCGPGNSTALLAEQWPNAAIVGIDKSREMLAEAARLLPDVTWLERDFDSDLADLGFFDLVFSNAALQWSRDRDQALAGLYRLVKPGGFLAVQVPNNGDSPFHQIVDAVAASRKWKSYFGQASVRIYDPCPVYYQRLASLGGDFSLWETTYYHRMDTMEDIIAWHQGTYLRPFIQALADASLRAGFIADICSQFAMRVTPEVDGKIINPFKRLFFTIRK